MGVLHEYNALDRDVLFQLAALSEPSGHDIGDAINDLYSSDVNQSGIYQILNSFREDGLVEKRDSDGYGNAYVLTESGCNALREYHNWTSERLPNR